MVTAWCLAVAFLAPWVVGAPLVWLLRGCRPLRRADWPWVPFVGLAGIVCPLHNLAVWADLPLARTVPWFWVATGALWAAFVARPAGRASLRAGPARLVLLSLAAFLGTGAGLVREGVERHRGNLLSDQYNYVVLAQFAADVPHSTGWADAGERPWVALALSLKGDRLGQSVLHGFLAVTAGRDCLDLFFPTLFLGSALLVPALRLLLPRFGVFGRAADLLALCGALVPGVTTIAADCYLSHALFIPVLFAYSAAVVRAVRRPAALALAGVLGVLGFSVYPEFLPLHLGVGAVAAAAAWASRRASLGRAAAVALAPLAALAFNPAACASAASVAARASQLGRQIDLPLSWGTMLGRVWLDVVRVQAPPSAAAAWLAAGVAAACFALSALGWVRHARGAVRRRAWVPAATAAALMFLPPVVAAASPNSRYAVFKLLTTASPLFVVGLGLLARPRPGEREQARARGRLTRAAVAAVVVLVAADNVAHRATTRRLDLKLAAAEWNDDGVRRLAERLKAEPPADVVLLMGDDGRSWVSSGVLLYHARHHRVRIGSPRRLWLEDVEAFPGTRIVAEPRPPAGALVVVRVEAEGPVAGEVLVRTPRHVLVRTADPRPDRAGVASR